MSIRFSVDNIGKKVYPKANRKQGSAQILLLILILLIIGGLVGGALVFLSVSKGGAVAPTVIQQPKIVFPPGASFTTFAPIVAMVKPAVVNIHSEQIIRSPFRGLGRGQQNPFEQFFGDDFFRRFFQEFDRNQKVTSLGSGVIIDSAGYVLTNNHVIDKADKINIKLADGTFYKGEVVGRDPKTDIAVLKISRLGGGFPAAKLGDSGALNVGDFVLAIGIPFNLSETVTHGIVSALGRKGFGVADYEDFIQTDAPINPGNSGGPLVNMKGEVVGINTFIVTQGAQQSAGVGFAIPSNLVKKVYADIRAKGKVVRGYLGVGLQDLTPELSKSFGVSNGVIVRNVMENSPSGKAGIKAGDVIVKFDGKKVSDGSELRDLVVNTSVGKKVTIELWRKTDKKFITVQVLVAEMPENLPSIQESESEKPSEDLLGLAVRNVTPDIARQLRLQKTTGVVVTDVNPEGLASDVIQPGDIILEVNDTAIANTTDYHRVISQVKKGQSILLRVYRDGGYLYVTIKLE